MEKLTISERTEIAQRIKSVESFYCDLALFREKFPFSRLNNELARVNEYNQERLAGQVIYELLSTVSEDEILENRLVIHAQEAAAKAEAEGKAQEEATAEDEAEGKAQEEAAAEAEAASKAQEEAAVEDEAEGKAQEEAPLQKKTKGKSKKNSLE